MYIQLTNYLIISGSYIADSRVVGEVALLVICEDSLNVLQYDVVQHNEMKVSVVTFWEHV